MIELKNVSKTFKTAKADVEAVRNVSVHIKKGDIFGIIGLSGAGKSTLVRCINFLERPTNGQVLLEGVDLCALSAKQLRAERKKMSMIFQNFNLLSQRTALKNVCYPLEISGVPKAQAIGKARQLLDLVGLQDRENSYPSQLSGGQKQRVAIARALATDPKVLLCDEATSALDPNTTRSILELLKNINQTLGVTIVVITHEMKVVEQICGRVAVMDSGEVVEQGEVKDLFISPKSQIARELILPKSEYIGEISKGRVLRVIFDGRSSGEPIISNLSLECRAAVNILGASTKDIDGVAYGHMLIRLPDEPTSEARILEFLRKHEINYEEAQL